MKKENVEFVKKTQKVINCGVFIPKGKFITQLLYLRGQHGREGRMIVRETGLCDSEPNLNAGNREPAL